MGSHHQVVSRGGFHVGNGINWKGQVFSKMRNHTILNKMTVILMATSETFVIDWFTQIAR